VKTEIRQSGTASADSVASLEQEDENLADRITEVLMLFFFYNRGRETWLDIFNTFEGHIFNMEYQNIISGHRTHSSVLFFYNKLINYNYINN
jgi:hypothetical protein